MDAGHRETDEVIEKMEKQIAKIYGDVEKDLKTNLDNYLELFKVEDEAQREMLEKGEISQKQYDGWRREQLMTETRLKEMRETIAKDLHNSNNIARSVVNGYMPEVYAINHNFGTFQIEHDALVDTSYTLYDRQTVERLMREDPDLLPPLSESKNEAKAAAKDIKWQSQQFNAAMTKSILMGDSIPTMAARISNDLGLSNMNAAVRYARTAATGAQNAGRVDSYERAQKMGIELEQEWLATLDERTRDEHRELDGQHVPVGEPFEVDGEEIRYPGDPSAPGYLVWNCRCTLVPKLKNLDQSDAPRNSKLGDISYDEWKNEQKHEQTKETDDIATNRQEAYDQLSKMFGSVESGLDKIDEDLLVENVNALAELNRRFGAIGSDNPGYVTAREDRNTIAKTSAGFRDKSVQHVNLTFSQTYYSSTDLHEKTEKESQRSFFSMPCDEKYIRTYTITHEYGLILEASISRRRVDMDELHDRAGKLLSSSIEKSNAVYDKAQKDSAKEIFTEIVGIAKEKNPDFKLSENLSEYGRTNYYEAFAETFANSQCGAPNELGLAMNEWLRKEGYQ